MNVQQQSASQVRIKATKGFFATVAGQYSEVNPDSIVDVSRELAAMMVSSNKAVVVDNSTPLVRTAQKARPVVVDPSVERLDRLQASIERLSEIVANLVTAQAATRLPSAKEK